MGNEASTGNVTTAFKATKRSGNLLLAGWQKRKLPTQLFGVVRHTERADGVFAFWENSRWSSSDDCRRFPPDPPLSDAGHEQADVLGVHIQHFAEQKGTDFHVVVCSPYARCVQTAVKICAHLGPKVKLLIDQSLGEIYGPSVMGEVRPRDHMRAFSVALDYAKAHGVNVVRRQIGQSPVWPESLQDARKRFALRFLQYLQRGTVAKRNFLIVTHGDCIGSVMGIMPEQQDYLVEKVEYGATILASSEAPQRLPPAPKPSAGRGMSAVMPMTAEEEAMVASNNGFSEMQDRLEHIIEGLEDTEGSNQRELAADKWAMPLEPESQKGPEVNKLTQKAMTGWSCETMNITVRQKKSKGSKLVKRLNALVESGPFSMKKVEKLLGAIPQTPLGDSTPLPLSSPANHSTTLSVQSGLSASTYLFGGSQVDSEQDLSSISPAAIQTPQNQRVLSSQLDLKRRTDVAKNQRSSSAMDKLSMKNYLSPLEGVLEDLENRSASKRSMQAPDPGDAQPRQEQEEQVVLSSRNSPVLDSSGSPVSLLSQGEEVPRASELREESPKHLSHDTTATAVSSAATAVAVKPKEMEMELPKKTFNAPGGSSLLQRRRASLGIAPLGQ